MANEITIESPEPGSCVMWTFRPSGRYRVETVFTTDVQLQVKVQVYSGTALIAGPIYYDVDTPTNSDWQPWPKNGADPLSVTQNYDDVYFKAELLGVPPPTPTAYVLGVNIRQVCEQPIVVGGGVLAADVEEEGVDGEAIERDVGRRRVSFTASRELVRKTSDAFVVVAERYPPPAVAKRVWTVERAFRFPLTHTYTASVAVPTPPPTGSGITYKVYFVLVGSDGRPVHKTDAVDFPTI